MSDGPRPELAEGAELPRGLAERLPGHLAHQRWWRADADKGGVRVVAAERLADARPSLWWLLVESAGSTFQLLVGVRDEAMAAGVLDGQDAALIGPVEDAWGPGVAYDATVDGELCLHFAAVKLALAGTRVRPVGAEQSNTSFVVDDRVIVKLFRQVMRGANPEVEVALALDRVGFNHLPAPVAHWRRDDLDVDLALAQEYLRGGAEGWALALASLRDLLEAGAAAVAAPAAPASGARALEDPSAGPGGGGGPDAGGAIADSLAGGAGADFSPDAARLGVMVAKLHAGLGEAFGTEPGRPEAWAASIQAQLEALSARTLRSDDAGTSAVAELVLAAPHAAKGLLERLAGVRDAGTAIRVHGDLHLGQVMRADAGWFALDFEGEPDRPLAERVLRTSPTKDVAGMLRSLDYAAAVALAERATVTPWLRELARAWVRINRRAFLRAYLSQPSLRSLLPDGLSDFEVLLAAFEVEKAAYELGYELDHRPSWAGIPAAGLEELLEAWG